VDHVTGRLSAAAIAFGAVLILLGGCTRPDTAEFYATRCEPREVQTAGIDVSLTNALARQAEENRTYRDCLERRSVRLAR
jgi:hypothetical protein